jgi:metallo-beta-lactamase family protein
MPTIAFHGAARTVTGSRHLLTLGDHRVLVDCGLFQGPRELRERNWEPFPVDPASIDAIVLTHAHTDHIGYLPRVVAQGFAGQVFATHGTAGISRISLPDSARLQEEEARYHNKNRTSRHSPALPLYTERDAFEALRRMRPLKYGQWQDLPGRAKLRFLPAGHILGSAFAEIYFEDGRRILMTGDLGRKNTPIIRDPEAVDFAEFLAIESTYGDRLHGDQNPQQEIERILNQAYRDGSCVLVPSFAIGRTQELLYHLSVLQHQGRIPRIPLFVDSPMATSATVLYDHTREDHDVDMKDFSLDGKSALHPDHLEFVRDKSQSKALNARQGPMVIISGSGMCSGGRILHHLKQRLDDPTTVLLFTGYQGAGTLGREILDGAESVEIHRAEIPVRARIERLTSLSAHADQAEIIEWLANFKSPPKRTFLVHGEPGPQEALRDRIVERYGWDVAIPEYRQAFDLG